MKTIVSYDAAVKNLGVFVVEFMDDYQFQIKKLIDELTQLYEKINLLNKHDFLELAKITVENIDCFINSIIKIKYFNVVNLIKEKKAKKASMIERTKSLKAFLKKMDLIVPDPDIVLIEYQMKQNDISRTISNQILMYYIDCEQVELVGPSLKNTISFAPEYEYSNFIMKYSNYVANKKHTTANFKYYAQLFNIDYAQLFNIDYTQLFNIDYAQLFNIDYTQLFNIDYTQLFNINNKKIKKLDDIADSFMMIFSWLCR